MDAVAAQYKDVYSAAIVSAGPTLPSWRAAVVALAAVTLALAGAGGSAHARHADAAVDDPHPLPPDAMTVDVRELGRYGGRFVISQTSGPRSFNALLAAETSTIDVTERLFTTLTEFDNAAQRDVPMLAKSWETSPDGLTWTWHLRRGACFSDGHPITADDVLFSFEVACDSVLHPITRDLLVVGGRPFDVSKRDSFTVVIRIATPYALMVPATGAVRIMPRHVLEAAYRSGAFASAYTVSIAPESLVTSGPFRLSQYVPGEKTVLTRNPYWFGVDRKRRRLPYLDELVYLIVPDQDAADLRFRAGESDGIDNVKPENYPWYEKNQKAGDFTLYDVGPSLNPNFFWFNLNRTRESKPEAPAGTPCVGAVAYAWFASPIFRRAVSMAVDREAMIQSVFFGAAVKNFCTATAGNHRWHIDDLPHYDYNPKEARRLLASIGFRDRDGDGTLEDAGGHTVQFTLKTNSTNKLRTAMCVFVRDDLAKVGIKCIPAPVEFNTLVTNIQNDFRYEAVLLGLQSPTPPDPGMGQNTYRSSGLTHYWNIRQKAPETPEEVEIDSLMSRNVSTNDMAVRKQTWNRIQTLMNEQCWFIWLPTQIQKMPVRNRFGNVQPTVIPHRLLWNIDRVFVKSSRSGSR
jgi:peptide/nickel transport system substrate-binding protein